MILDNPYEAALVARLEDYFVASRHWCRQLWRIGSILESREVAESWEAHHRGALSESSVQYLVQSTIRRVKYDLGFGTERQRGNLIEHLKRRMAPGGHDSEALAILLLRHQDKYLLNWAQALRRDEKPPMEAVSRAVASHLMDAGFSRRAISAWLKYEIRQPDGPPVDAETLVHQANDLWLRSAEEYEIVIPVTASPPYEASADSCWMTRSETVAWMGKFFPDQAVRQTGALRLLVKARDLPSALGVASDEVVKMIARFRVGARKRLEFSDDAYVAGKRIIQDYRRKPRRVQVHGLQSTSTIFQRNLPGNLDAVLELLEPLDEGTPAAAVAGSWAALEAMFIGPEDTRERVRAATRMARILSCTYVVSELLALASAYETTHADAFSDRLRSTAENPMARARLMERSIQDRSMALSFSNSRHQATMDRMRQLVDNPAVVLPRITGQLEDAFRRLYRQRNLILHAGELASMTLRGTLRTTAPLMGAGIDQVIRTSASRGLTPIQLAAQAEVDLKQVAEGDGFCLAHLLA